MPFGRCKRLNFSMLTSQQTNTHIFDVVSAIKRARDYIFVWMTGDLSRRSLLLFFIDKTAVWHEKKKSRCRYLNVKKMGKKYKQQDRTRGM